MHDRHIFIATPTHDGNACAEYIRSMISTVALMFRDGVSFTHSFCVGNALIHDARNRLVSWFMANEEATDIFFIDADLGWDPEAFLQLARSPHDVIGGAYPQKRDDREIYNVSGPKPTVTGLIEVDYLGTGFLKISRKAIEKLQEIHKDKQYACPEGSPIYGLFEAPIENGMITGEDALFCRRWREAGGKVFLAPNISFQHVGRKAYHGNFAELAAREEKIMMSSKGEAA